MASLEFESGVNSIIASEINKLVDEIAWIDSRLASLDNSEESEAERKLLTILRKHLVKDLYELSGFVYSDDVESKEEGVESEILLSSLGDEVTTHA